MTTQHKMSPLLYTITCAIGSLLLIALADYAYRTISAKWGKSTSHARKQEQREHTDVAQHLVNTPIKSRVSSPVDNQSESETPDDLEAYAKALLKDSKRTQ